MLSEEVIKKESWLHFGDDILNLSIIKATSLKWHIFYKCNISFYML